MKQLDSRTTVFPAPRYQTTAPWGTAVRDRYTTTALKRRALTGTGFISIFGPDTRPWSVTQTFSPTPARNIRVQRSPLALSLQTARPSGLPPVGQRPLVPLPPGPYPINYYARATTPPPKVRMPLWPAVRSGRIMGRGQVEVVPYSWYGLAHRMPSQRYVVARNVRFAAPPAAISTVRHYPNARTEFARMAASR